MMGLVDSVLESERKRLIKALSKLKRGTDLDCSQLGYGGNLIKLPIFTVITSQSLSTYFNVASGCRDTV